MAIAAHSLIEALYTDIMGDLVPYFENQVLLPNSAMIANIYNIEGGAGDTVKVPVMSSYSPASTIANMGDTLLNGNDFTTTEVLVGVKKRGAGSQVYNESLEDGGLAVVRSNIVNQLSGALAQATDRAGLLTMVRGSETALTAVGNINVAKYGDAGTQAATTFEVGAVFSPMAMAYVSKRAPGVKIFENVSTDTHDIAASVRNGFAQLRTDHIKAVVSNAAIGGANSADLADFSMAVAALRAANAPTGTNGFYNAIISPAMEYALASQLNSVTQTLVGDLSNLGNMALASGIVSQCVGITFVRSSNLASYTNA